MDRPPPAPRSGSPVSVASAHTDDIPLSVVHSINIEYRTLSIQIQNDESGESPLFQFHKLSLEELERLLGTSTTRGLETSVASRRLARDGKNVLEPPRQGYFRQIMGYLFGGFGVLLWIGCIVCFLAWRPLGDPPEIANLGLAVLLVIVLLLQTAFNTYQDWTSAKVMQSINSMLPAICDVVRDGELRKIPVSDLVMGDRVLLRYGNKVPADMRLVECTDIELDKSILTGENDPISGTPEPTNDNYLESCNIALMGTLVTNGNGVGVVIATGESTVMGKISKLTTSSDTSRPTLQREINRFVNIIGTLALVTATIVLIAWGAWLRPTFPAFINTSGALVNAIAVLVAFVPVGLPIAITMSLTLVARNMAKQKVLVKNLMTVESLGSVNVIASDKTGTLTQNRMFVFHACAGSHYWSNAYNDTQPLSQYSAAFVQLLAASQLCNGATFDPKTKHLPVLDQRVNGDPTDSAMLRFGAHVGSQDETDALDLNGVEVTHRIPFNSKNKWMLSVVQPTSIASTSQTVSSAEISSLEESTSNQSPDRHVFGPSHQPTLLIKGAPDVLISKTKWYLNDDGSTKPFDDTLRRMVCEQQEVWSNQGQRVLMVCKRMLQSSQDLPTDPDDLQSLTAMAHSLCLVGLVSIVDPPRPETKQVVHECHEAGIRVFMVTGDYALTAAAIARQVGIFTQPQVDTLADLDQISVRSDNESTDVSEKSTPRSSVDLTGSKADDLLLDDNPETRSVSEISRKLVTSSAVTTTQTSPVSSKEKESILKTGDFDGKGEIFQPPASHSLHQSPSVSTSHQLTGSEYLAKFSGALLLSGPELSTLSDSQWDQVTQYREIVFARTTPEQKLQIVTKFQASGAVVGVTGDGVNDAPALKSANIGVAMGGGSEVAIEAAHMVLLDNNFSSILVAIEHGRLVFVNLKKCILYLLPAGSFAECVPILVNMFFGVPAPLSAFLMVCICVLTDMPSSISLMYEGPERNLLKLAPRDPNHDHLVNKRLLGHAYLFAGIMEAFFGHCMYFHYMSTYAGLSTGDLFFAFDKWRDGYHGYTAEQLADFQYTGQCIMFISLVMCQCFGNMLSIRTRYLSLLDHPPFPLNYLMRLWKRHAKAESSDSHAQSKLNGNPLMLIGWACSIGLAIIIVYLPFINHTFNTRPIPAAYFFMPVGYAMGMLLLDELRKWGVRRGVRWLSAIAW
ncbi:hypothetical protein IWQ62_002007 [Dispira parvispora]|uniref:P-type Cu(+) transporter n=1 Tax=Dispira parvispora TaxID=1520584 RepID=A0A9W8AWL5_9FUNG|nr:hypothetical protein IWQ62_002007 [Dispira parvispora]